MSLTTLQNVKIELGISLPDTQNDEYIERLIKAATDAIERYCQRHFSYQEGIVETVAGFGTSFILVSRTPLLTVQDIRILGVSIGANLDPSEYEIFDADSGSIYRQAGWPWSAQTRGDITRDPLPGTERKRIEVTYTGGFVTPDQEMDLSISRTLPYDLEQICIDTVVVMYRERGENKAITSESLMSASVSFDRSARLTQAAMAGLAPYQRIVQG